MPIVCSAFSVIMSVSFSLQFSKFNPVLSILQRKSCLGYANNLTYFKTLCPFVTDIYKSRLAKQSETTEAG